MYYADFELSHWDMKFYRPVFSLMNRIKGFGWTDWNFVDQSSLLRGLLLPLADFQQVIREIIAFYGRLESHETRGCASR